MGQPIRKAATRQLITTSLYIFSNESRYCSLQVVRGMNMAKSSRPYLRTGYVLFIPGVLVALFVNFLVDPVARDWGWFWTGLFQTGLIMLFAVLPAAWYSRRTTSVR